MTVIRKSPESLFEGLGLGKSTHQSNLNKIINLGREVDDSSYQRVPIESFG